MGRGPEREAPHTGTETRPRLLREAAVRDIGGVFERTRRISIG